MSTIRLFAAGGLMVAAMAAGPTLPADAARVQHPAAANAAVAAKTESLGSAGSWSAYASRDATGRVCYLVGEPQKSESAGVARHSPSAIVTHRPAENITNVVSFVEGYPLKEGSDVALEIGDKKFELFTKEDSAWARTAELDKTIVATLARAKSAVVKGLPQKGRPTSDTYALAGFDKALALIDKACGVKREVEAAAKPKHPPGHRHRKAAKATH